MSETKEKFLENLKSYGWILIVAVISVAAIVTVVLDQDKPVKGQQANQDIDIQVTNISLKNKELYFNLDSDYNDTIRDLTLCLKGDKLNQTCESEEIFNFSKEENISLNNFSRTDENQGYDLKIAYNLSERIELKDEISINAVPGKTSEDKEVMLNGSDEDSESGDEFFSGGGGSGGGGSSGGGSDDGSSDTAQEEEYQNPYFNINKVEYPNSIEAGDDVVFTAELENLGKATDAQGIELLVEGEREYYVPELTLLPGEVTSENLVWPTQFDYSGTYNYTIKTENESKEGQVYVGSWESPNAEIDINNTSPEAGETILLDASNSEPGDGELVGYTWQVNQTERTGEQITAQPESGIYNIELQVNDSLGETDTENRTINVTQ